MYKTTTFATAAIALASVFAGFSASAQELPAYQVNPKAQIVEELTQVVLTFPTAESVSESLEVFPTLTNGKDYDNGYEAYRLGTSVDGNKYVLDVRDALKDGSYVLTIPANTLTLDKGVEGKEVVYNEPIVLQYQVSADAAESSVSFLPAAGNVQSLSQIELTFNGASVVNYAPQSGEEAAVLQLNGENIRVFGPNNYVVKGNVMTFTIDPAATEEGEYTFVLPAAGYTVDGVAGSEDVTVVYNVALPKYSVNPKAPIVDALEQVVVTFPTATEVTELEYSTITVKDAAGTIYRNLTSVEGNALTIKTIDTLGAGTYVFNIPANTLAVDGEAYPEDITLQFTVAPELPAYQVVVTPANGSVVPELNVFTLEFTGDEVETVGKAAEYSSENAPYVTVNGERFATVTKVEVEGKVLSLTLSAPVEEAGEYTLVVPGQAYTLNGIPGEDLSYVYTVRPVKYTIAPKADVLEVLEKVVITFPAAETVEEELYTVFVKDAAGNDHRSTTNLEGNVYTISLIEPIVTPGQYTVTVPAGTLKVDGVVYNAEISQTYAVLPELPEFTLVANPADGSKVAELNTVVLTFEGENIAVATAAEFSSDNAPYVKDAEGNRIATFTTVTASENTLSMSLYAPISEDGDYTVVVPAAAYTLNGQEDVEIELNYSVKAVKYTIAPKADVLDVLEKVVITFPEATEVTEELYDVFVKNAAGDVFRVKTEVEGNQYTINLIDPITVAGVYNVTVPANTLAVDGELFNAEISATYAVVPETPEYNVVANPADNSEVKSLQTITLTFEGVETVALAKELDSDSAPYVANEEGVRYATFTNVTCEGNVVTLGLFGEFTEKGAFQVVVPADLLTVDGAFADEIVLNYTVTGLSGIDSVLGVEVENATVYDINGRVVKGNLNKGVYIINGVKVIK